MIFKIKDTAFSMGHLKHDRYPHTDFFLISGELALNVLFKHLIKSKNIVSTMLRRGVLLFALCLC